MPRTAVTLGKTHKGQWKLLAHPDVPIVEQLANFRSGLGEKSHPEFCLIQLQESDGHVRQIKLRSPSAQQAHDDLRNKELSKAKEAGEAEEKAALERKAKVEDEREKSHKDEIEARNKETLSNPNRGGKAATEDKS